ncbi:J domain-containing protein [Desnuesiella massiliensis]|uniref:J domain-containing protein n=1 Tax=Desnuesiella massiliensis TaxID=1650662 RepID=UPI0006E28E88|nr:DnaJ domain-containing protein [Desnuesiella massiliensis]
MENLYDILEIDLSSDEKEIKKAYVKMVRKYPPEKAPEEFKKIRKAFEILIDPTSRAEYLARLKYGDEIDDLEKNADEAMEYGEYDKAITAYKKILIIEPNMNLIKNKLALAMIYNEQIDEGIEQLKKLVESNPNDSMYIGNLAYGYKQKNDLNRAEEHYIRALSIDGHDEINLSTLINIYMDKKEYHKAISYLDNNINSNKTEDFREFIYYYEKIRVYTYENKPEEIKQVIFQMKNLMPKDEEINSYVMWRFYTLANSLYKNGMFNLGEIITASTLELYGENPSIINLYDECKELSMLNEEFQRLCSDSRIIEVLKSPIYYYLYRFTMSYEEYEKGFEQMLKEVKENIKSNRKSMIKSVKILKEEYYQLYTLKKDLYDDICESS